MSVHTTKGAQENAIAAAVMVKQPGTLLIGTGVVTKAEAARVIRVAEAEAASVGTASGPAVAGIIRDIGRDRKGTS